MKIKKIVGLVTLLSVGVVSVSFASIDKNLKYGQRDKEVTELQEFLIDKGLLKSTPSTYFGLLTFKAVKAYQTSIGVSPTGFVGVLTREKINKEINTEIASSNEAEIKETGTTTVAVFASGCKSNVGFSIITGKPCSVIDNTVKIEIKKEDKTIDFCKNIEGLQTSVPLGMLLNSEGYCLDNANKTQIIDVCKNIEGLQTIPPSDMKIDSFGNCSMSTVNQLTQPQTVISENTGGLQTYAPVIISKKDITITKSVNSPTRGFSNLEHVNNTMTTKDTASFRIAVMGDDGNQTVSKYVYVTSPEGVRNKISKVGDYFTYTYQPTKTGSLTFIFDVPELGVKKETSVTVTEPGVPMPKVFNLNYSDRNTCDFSLGKEVRVGSFVVRANSDGKILVEKLPINLNFDSISNPEITLPRVSVASVTLKDVTISGSSFMTISFSPKFIINTSMQETFDIYATIKGNQVSTNCSVVTSSLGDPSSFLWSDGTSSYDGTKLGSDYGN